MGPASLFSTAPKNTVEAAVTHETGNRVPEVWYSANLSENTHRKHD